MINFKSKWGVAAIAGVLVIGGGFAAVNAATAQTEPVAVVVTDQPTVAPIVVPTSDPVTVAPAPVVVPEPAPVVAPEPAPAVEPEPAPAPPTTYCPSGTAAGAVDDAGNESNCQPLNNESQPCVAYNDNNECTAWLKP